MGNHQAKGIAKEGESYKIQRDETIPEQDVTEGETQYINLEQVPPEVLERILWYLMPADLLQLERVSHNSAQIVRDPAVWRSLCTWFCDRHLLHPVLCLPLENASIVNRVMDKCDASLSPYPIPIQPMASFSSKQTLLEDSSSNVASSSSAAASSSSSSSIPQPLANEFIAPDQSRELLLLPSSTLDEENESSMRGSAVYSNEPKPLVNSEIQPLEVSLFEAPSKATEIASNTAKKLAKKSRVPEEKAADQMFAAERGVDRIDNSTLSIDWRLVYRDLAELPKRRQFHFHLRNLFGTVIEYDEILFRSTSLVWKIGVPKRSSDHRLSSDVLLLLHFYLPPLWPFAAIPQLHIQSFRYLCKPMFSRSIGPVIPPIESGLVSPDIPSSSSSSSSSSTQLDPASPRSSSSISKGKNKKKPEQVFASSSTSSQTENLSKHDHRRTMLYRHYQLAWSGDFSGFFKKQVRKCLLEFSQNYRQFDDKDRYRAMGKMVGRKVSVPSIKPEHLIAGALRYQADILAEFAPLRFLSTVHAPYSHCFKFLPFQVQSEYIMFCLDLHFENTMVNWNLHEESEKWSYFTRFDLIKDAIWHFVHLKSVTNRYHKFGISIFGKETHIIQKFTDDLPSFGATLFNLKCEEPTFAPLPPPDIPSFLKFQQALVQSILPNPSIACKSVRSIVIYGRSNMVPIVGDLPFRQAVASHIKSIPGSFTIDVCFIHRSQKPGDQKKSPPFPLSQIIDAFNSLVLPYGGTVWHTDSPNALSFHEQCAIMLAHRSQFTAASFAHWKLGGQSVLP